MIHFLFDFYWFFLPRHFKRYVEAAKTISYAIQDVKRTPTQEAADWIEYSGMYAIGLFLKNYL